MKKTVYYIYILLGAACWGMIGLFTRTLGELGVTVFQRVTIRNFGALVVMISIRWELALVVALGAIRIRRTESRKTALVCTVVLIVCAEVLLTALNTADSFNDNVITL